jgi:hypothetical protein
MDTACRTTLGLLFVCIVSAWLSGCDREPESLHPGELNLHSTRGGEWDPNALPLTASSDPESTPPEYEQIIASVEAQGTSMFVEAPPPAVLHELELVYFTTAQIFELANMYKQVVDEQGIDHPIAPRLAYLYARLGQQTHAEELSTEVRDARPEDPFAWFVYGFVRGQREQPNRQSLREIEQAFTKVLELDPEFSMPGGISSRQIAQQRDALRQRLDMEEPSEALETQQAPTPSTQSQPSEGTVDE